jgi:hypothetical protein
LQAKDMVKINFPYLVDMNYPTPKGIGFPASDESLLQFSTGVNLGCPALFLNSHFSPIQPTRSSGISWRDQLKKEIVYQYS